MGTITKMLHKKDRVWIYIDGQYCTSIRKRTFDGMGLFEGMNITSEQLKEKEEFFWKEMYGKSSWKKEKVRLKKVKDFIKLIDVDDIIDIKEVGFGSDSELMIKKHPDESGSPDLGVKYKTQQEPFMYIEVSGTETMRGKGYWVRPDKLEYSKRHPQKDVWIMLHYQNPVEKLVIIKPDNDKEYYHTEIRRDNGATEYYVIFNDGAEEIKTSEEFKNHLKKYL